MDEDIDKTGYSKVKTEALSKALKYSTQISDITIGPDACPASLMSENVTPSAPSDITFQPKPRKVGADFSQSDDTLIAENEREEERYCTKKLLAELNNFCIIDGQKMKFYKMKKHLEKLECAKKEAERMIADYEAKFLIQNQQRQEQVSSIQSRLLVRQKQLISSTSISRDCSTKKIQEIKKQEEEQTQQMKEKALEKKKLYDSVYKNEVEFKNAYRELVDIVMKCKEIKQIIASDVDLASKINVKFIALIDRCKKGDISPADVALSSSLIGEITRINTKIKEEKGKFDAKLVEEKKEDEEMEENTLEKEQEKREDIGKSVCPEIIPSVGTPKHGSKYDYMAKYNSVNDFLLEVERKLKPFITDETFKKFRSDCQKAVNLPVNAISPCSAAHLTDKLKKLSNLLQGQYVIIADKRVTAISHPLGLIYCKNLLAEKIVKQGEQVVSSKPDAAFAIAAVTVALWMEFPDFGKLLLAHFYRRCPYLIPVYWEREENQSEEEYYKKLGFTYSEGTREDLNMFLKRQGGIVRLFGSIMIAEKKKSLQSLAHPLGLGEGWKLLVALIKLDPKAEISATVLFDILEVVGDSMVKAYKIQFHKLLHVVCKSYLPRIVEVTAEGMHGGPLCRLKNFLESIAKGKVLQPPKGLLPPNFW